MTYGNFLRIARCDVLFKRGSAATMVPSDVFVRDNFSIVGYPEVTENLQTFRPNLTRAVK
jgi:hypothetical protein